MIKVDEKEQVDRAVPLHGQACARGVVQCLDERIRSSILSPS